MSMPVSAKRKLYTCGKAYHTLDDVPPWPLYARLNKVKPVAVDDAEFFKYDNIEDGDGDLSLAYRRSLAVSIFSGDITTLEIDAVVNAANRPLHGGGGVDGAIHRAAGSELVKESMSLAPCEVGDVKVTGGYKLPAKYVFHTVGPRGERPTDLRKCYQNSLNMCVNRGLRTIAIPCISTGVYGYPNEAAAKVVIDVVHKWLSTGDNLDKIDRIILCLFMDTDIAIYRQLLPIRFLLTDK